jgi:hypothetical protein
MLSNPADGHRRTWKPARSRCAQAGQWPAGEQEVRGLSDIDGAADAGLNFTADGWVMGADGTHLGRIDEGGHVWRLSGELLGRLDDQGYVRNKLGGVLGRIDGDLSDDAIRRQLWTWLSK